MVLRILAVLLAIVVALPARADPAALEALRGYDLRLAGIAYRLTTANAALCRDLAPNLGIALHGLGQYGDRAEARAMFGFDAPIAVEGIVPGGPAARAGVVANDSVVAIGGTPFPREASPGAPNSAGRDAALALLDSQPPGAPVMLSLLRGGVRRDVVVAAVPACRSAFELLLGPGHDAQADGRIVQLSVGFLEDYSDAEVAVVVAHELAHNVLRHRARLEAAGVKGGLLKEFGRNRRLTRVVEEQADLLSVHLLRNAGYDPATAVAFWRDHGGGISDALLRSRTHPSSSARANAIGAEIARIPRDAALPYVPPMLADRDRPLGD